jgi:hypothetical protein
MFRPYETVLPAAYLIGLEYLNSFTDMKASIYTWYFYVPECFSTLRVESDSAGCQEQNFTVFTGLEVPGMSTGFVEIAPFCEAYSVVESNLVSSVFSSWCLVCVLWGRWKGMMMVVVVDLF